MLKLYTYWRSTAAYRVRIALNLKNLKYQSIPIHLVKNGGEQNSDQFKTLNPQALVPALQTETGEILTQSMAIIEYLEENYPDNTLLPESTTARAQCRAMAQVIACEVHPLNNLRVLKYLKSQQWQQQQVDDWYHHWVHQGFIAIEKSLDERTHQYMFADYPCLSDIVLVAQIYNARRFEVCLDAYPNIQKIEAMCSKLSAFEDARPENQHDKG
ncbi:MAG: maleylacetoacetate isomerase [Candidatus Marinimicrobia bacterium]|nr:maleylacetoacetate isomerase [Candidatus Neomarinimicrobiota bacterium]